MDRLSCPAGLTAAAVLEATARPPLQAGRAWVWQIEAPVAMLRAQTDLLLAQLLTDYCGASAAASLRRLPGRPVQCAAHWQGLPLAASVSYAGARALIALAVGLQVGVDIAVVQSVPEWHAVAQLYLGRDMAELLAAVPPAARPQAFAQAWTELEARSKCQGLPLAEWAPARHQALARAAVVPLAVSGAYAAALAVA